MKTKIILAFVCFIFVFVAFNGCGGDTANNNDESTTKNNSFFSDWFNKIPADTSEESLTNDNSSGSGKPDTNKDANKDVTTTSADETIKNGEASLTQSSHNTEEKESTTVTTFNSDSRLIGVWNASTEIPITEDGKTVTSRCSINFKENGTFEQATTEAQARRMIIDTYLTVFNCQNEQELDNYLRKNKGITLEAYVLIALAQMTDSDFQIKGTWKTENDNTLYETTMDGEKENVEVIKYVFSNDKNSVKLTIEDGSGGTT
ncbi:MAG: hypothetical protein IKW45_07610, partial [Clostridia bacterium]|nr:hypothetical protein [Clostridia bacterium]